MDNMQELPTPLVVGRAKGVVGLWGVTLGLGLLLCATVIPAALHSRLETGAPLGELVVWLAFVLFADLLAVPLTSEVLFTMSLPVLLAAGMVFQPWVAATLAMAGYVDAREFRGGICVQRALLNRFQVALSAMAASWVFHALGGSANNWPSVLIPAALALATDCLLNATLTASAVSLVSGVALPEALRALPLGPGPQFVLTYVCSGMLALLLATLYEYVGVWGLVVGVAPVLLAGQMLAEARRALDTSRALHEKSRAFRAVTEQVVAERHDERHRIACSLHDDVLQSLHYLTLHAQVIREDLRHGRLLQLEEDVPMLLRASQETADLTRGVIKDLRSSPLGRGGVAATLLQLAEQLRDEFRGRITTDISPIHGDDILQTTIYQVGREALTNAVRHSNAREIAIALDETNNRISLAVTDDGRGCDDVEAGRADHFGIHLMKERVSNVNGELSLESSSGMGTRVRAEFPR